MGPPAVGPHAEKHGQPFRLLTRRAVTALTRESMREIIGSRGGGLDVHQALIVACLIPREVLPAQSPARPQASRHGGRAPSAGGRLRGALERDA